MKTTTVKLTGNRNETVDVLVTQGETHLVAFEGVAAGSTLHLRDKVADAKGKWVDYPDKITSLQTDRTAPYAIPVRAFPVGTFYGQPEARLNGSSIVGPNIRYIVRPAAAVESPTEEPDTQTPPAKPFAEFGVTGDTGDEPDAYTVILKSIGVKHIRVWLGVNGTDEKSLARLRAWRAAGIQVLATINPSERKDPATGKLRDVTLGGGDWAKRWADTHAAKLLPCVDRVGFGNEWNFPNVYTPSDAGGAKWHRYYADTLRVFAAGVRAINPGVAVMSIPIADDWSQKVYTDQYKLLAAEGVFEVVDEVDVHPYCQPSQIEQMRANLFALAELAKKPLVSSEFNLSAKANDARTQYPLHIGRYIQTLAPFFKLVCAFRLDPTSRWAWPTVYDGAGRLTPDMGEAFAGAFSTVTGEARKA